MITAQEKGEWRILTLAVAAGVAGVTAPLLLLVIAGTTAWRPYGGTFGNVLFAFAASWDFVRIAFAVVTAAVTYTILQEIVLRVDRAGRHAATPMGLLIVLIPVAAILGSIAGHIMDRSLPDPRSLLYAPLIGIPLMLLAFSVPAAPWAGAPLLLRHAMGRSSGAWAASIYAIGLLGLIPLLFALGSVLRGHREESRGFVIFVIAASGFLAGGVSQLLIPPPREPDGPLADAPPARTRRPTPCCASAIRGCASGPPITPSS